MHIPGQPFNAPPTGNSVNTAPPVQQPPAPPVPPPVAQPLPQDTTERVQGGPANAPVGLPVGLHEPDPTAAGRRVLREIMEDGDTDRLARFLRELRQGSPAVARGVAVALYREAEQHHAEGRISADLLRGISDAIIKALDTP